MTDAGTFANFPGNSASFKFKRKITASTRNDSTKAVQIMIPLKYLSNFWRTLVMTLIKYEVNLILTWSTNCPISNADNDQNTTFAITDAKLYVPIIIFSTLQNYCNNENLDKNSQLIEILNAANLYLDFSIEPSFPGGNRIFVLPFNALDNRMVHSRYYLPTAKVKYYNVMINGKNFFDQPIKSYVKTYESIQKITTGQGDDFATGCLLGYNYFKKHYKMIAIDLSKQQALDADPKAIQQINFIGNLDGNNKRLMFFII